MRVELVIDTTTFQKAMYDAMRSLTDMHIRMKGGHTDGAYAEVMLREHLQALAKQGLDRKGHRR